MLTIPHEQLIFVDEACFQINMVAGFGRGLIGQRIRLNTPNTKGINLNMIGALTTQGLLHMGCYYGNTDRNRYIEFVNNLKIQHPYLFENSQMYAIQDGASIHRGQEVIDAWHTGF